MYELLTTKQEEIVSHIEKNTTIIILHFKMIVLQFKGIQFYNSKKRKLNKQKLILNLLQKKKYKIKNKNKNENKNHNNNNNNNLEG